MRSSISNTEINIKTSTTEYLVIFMVFSLGLFLFIRGIIGVNYHREVMREAMSSARTIQGLAYPSSESVDKKLGDVGEFSEETIITLDNKALNSKETIALLFGNHENTEKIKQISNRYLVNIIQAMEVKKLIDSGLIDARKHPEFESGLEALLDSAKAHLLLTKNNSIPKTN